MNKLIETALPLSKIRETMLRERTGGVGHPANLHMWWGRSPLASMDTMLIASLVDAPDSREELLCRLERVQQGCYAEFGDKPTVFDPFAGFGGIPLAAQRLNLPIIAGDLNPVAVMLTKAAAEIPVKFGNRFPVNPESLNQPCVGATGIAEDVAYYGDWMCRETKKRLSHLYPDERQETPAAWIWVRTVKCPNPACGCQMPLSSSYILSGKTGNEIWAEPVLQDQKIRFKIRTGSCPEESRSNKIGRNGAVFRCPVCGNLTTDEYVKQMGKAHQIGAQMIAVVVETSAGKQYLSPTIEQEKAADVPLPEEIPHGDIPDNPHWFSPPGFGMTSYSDLYSPRQLTLLTTMCSLLSEVQDRAASDALAAGMSASGGSLAEGGTGALAYGQAVSVYLSFVIDKLADSNSTICSWRTSGGLRNTFGRQAIPMVWTYAEGNPFSGITGNYFTSLKNVVEAIKKLPCGSQASVYQGDALTIEFPEDVLVCTELPYYKSIGYAHLSDFFYIWMRRSLKSIFPELFNQMVTSKEELSTVGQYYGEDPMECVQKYEADMRAVVEKLYTCATSAYPTLLFYEFHKADFDSIRMGNICDDRMAPFELMLSWLEETGFTISSLWPLRSASGNSDGIRILIVAKKKDRIEQITRRSFIASLKRELPGLLEQVFCAGVDDEDRVLVGIGAGLSVFTSYKRVINADGTRMNIHDALQIIYEETAEWVQCNAENDDCACDVTMEG